MVSLQSSLATAITFPTYANVTIEFLKIDCMHQKRSRFIYIFPSVYYSNNWEFYDRSFYVILVRKMPRILLNAK